MRTADLPTSEWGKVHIVHDAHLIHDVQRAGWHGAGMTAIVDAVDKEATKLFKAEFNADFADPPKKKPGGGRGGRVGGDAALHTPQLAGQAARTAVACVA